MTAIIGTSLLALVLLACAGSASHASDDFEKHARPLLVEKCQSCHGAEMAKGGLRLDSRAALLKVGDSGPAAAPSGTRTTTPERRTTSAIGSATTRTGTNTGDGVWGETTGSAARIRRQRSKFERVI